MLTAQAMAPASIFSLAFVIYTGFTIPTKDMHPWFRWLNYLNPVGYAFESLIINEVPTLFPNMTAGSDNISFIIAPFLVRDMFPTARTMTMRSQMRGSVQPPELLPEQTSSMEIPTWQSTSTTRLVIFGGIWVSSLR